jgi:DNA-binding transcriptional MerR regulator/methylmalonyl-CoA mutase cobalamin-binding subunit
MGASTFNIAAVERDVGLSKDVLRVWERRYGFPSPQRADNGERLYPAAQVERLRVIKRLMDQGHRPGRLLASSDEELRSLGAFRAAALGGSTRPHASLEPLVDLITRHELDAYVQALQQRLARDGLQRFVQDTVAPLSGLIGVAWQEGRLQVFEEHLFTELTERVLRHAIAAVPGGTTPRILLTTVPNEQHAMGLLMAEALMSLEGALCIPLGTQVPLLDIERAASAHRVHIVALSFSAAFPKRQVALSLRQLRSALAPAIDLWVGGAGARRVVAPDQVTVMGTLQDATAALTRWRNTH